MKTLFRARSGPAELSEFTVKKIRIFCAFGFLVSPFAFLLFSWAVRDLARLSLLCNAAFVLYFAARRWSASHPPGLTASSLGGTDRSASERAVDLFWYVILIVAGAVLASQWATSFFAQTSESASFHPLALVIFLPFSFATNFFCIANASLKSSSDIGERWELALLCALCFIDVIVLIFYDRPSLSVAKFALLCAFILANRATGMRRAIPYNVKMALGAAFLSYGFLFLCVTAILRPPVSGAFMRQLEFAKQIVFASESTMLTAAGATAVAAVIGISAGVLAHYPWPSAGRSILFATKQIEAIPKIILLMICFVLVDQICDDRTRAGKGIFVMAAVLGATFSTELVRSIHAKVEFFKSQDFVVMQRLNKCSSARIYWHHIFLKNCGFETLLKLSQIFAASMLTELSLMYLYEIGFGRSGAAHHVSWGALLAKKRQELMSAEGAFLVLVVISTVAGLYLFTDGFREEVESPPSGKKAKPAFWVDEGLSRLFEPETSAVSREEGKRSE